MPVIVREYLETQDESKRAAARAAAWDAAWDAAWAATQDAAWDAVQKIQSDQFVAVFCTEEGEGLK